MTRSPASKPFRISILPLLVSPHLYFSFVRNTLAVNNKRFAVGSTFPQLNRGERHGDCLRNLSGVNHNIPEDTSSKDRGRTVNVAPDLNSPPLRVDRAVDDGDPARNRTGGVVSGRKFADLSLLQAPCIGFWNLRPRRYRGQIHHRIHRTARLRHSPEY